MESGVRHRGRHKCACILMAIAKSSTWRKPGERRQSARKLNRASAGRVDLTWPGLDLTGLGRTGSDLTRLEKRDIVQYETERSERGKTLELSLKIGIPVWGKIQAEQGRLDLTWKNATWFSSGLCELVCYPGPADDRAIISIMNIKQLISRQTKLKIIGLRYSHPLPSTKKSRLV